MVQNQNEITHTKSYALGYYKKHKAHERGCALRELLGASIIFLSASLMLTITYAFIIVLKAIFN